MGNRALPVPLNSEDKITDKPVIVGAFKGLKCHNIITQYNEQVKARRLPPYVIISDRRLTPEERQCLEEVFASTKLMISEVEDNSYEMFMGLAMPTYYKIILSRESIPKNNDVALMGDYNQDDGFNSKRHRIYND